MILIIYFPFVFLRFITTMFLGDILNFYFVIECSNDFTVIMQLLQLNVPQSLFLFVFN